MGLLADFVELRFLASKGAWPMEARDDSDVHKEAFRIIVVACGNEGTLIRGGTVHF